MGVLIYLAALRVKRIFDFKSHPAKTIGTIFFLLIASFYGYLFAYLFNSREYQKVLPQSELIRYLISMLTVITFLRGFIPSYVPIKNIIPKNYPVSKAKRFLYNLINELIYPFYFGMILFVLTFSINIGSEGIKFSFIALSWIVISHLLKRLIQFSIEFNFEKKDILLTVFILSVLIVSYFILFDKIEIYTNYAVTLSALVALLAVNFLFQNKYKESKQLVNKVSKKEYFNMYIIKLLFNNNSLRTMIFVSVIMKSFFAFGNMGSMMNRNEISMFWEAFLNFILSPLILFTYVFNNSFGFAKTTWLTINKVGADLSSYFIFLLKMVAIPLMIDAGVGIIFYVYLNIFNYTNIMIYINSAIVLFFIGLINSFYFPIKVQGLFSFRANVSIMANVVSMISVAGIILLANISIIISVSVSILVSFGIYYYAEKKMSLNRYEIFTTLFR